jgi:hypothetical protein
MPKLRHLAGDALLAHGDVALHQLRRGGVRQLRLAVRARVRYVLPQERHGDDALRSILVRVSMAMHTGEEPERSSSLLPSQECWEGPHELCWVFNRATP